MEAATKEMPGSLFRVLRNASHLLAAQVVGMPIAILINAVAARKLGAAEYGLFYQAGAFAGFAFLLAEWGQPAVLTGQVAMNRDRAGELLGSGLASRVAAGLAAVVLVPALAWTFGYDARAVLLLSIALVGCLVGTVSGACQDVFRGMERADFAAVTSVAWQLLGLIVAVPLLLAGGTLEALMLAQVACGVMMAAFIISRLPSMQVPRLRLRRETVIELARRGHPFVAFSLVLAVQPMFDTAVLSRLADDGTMGWYGTSRKLVGVLVFPAAALLGALYPTLCRLRTESAEAFRRTATEALQVAAAIAMPAAVGCLFFPELGVGLFGGDAYAPAADNLRVLAPWLLLVYVSMPVGSCLTAAGRQGAWTLVLVAGALTGAALDLVLVPWFAQHAGNAGLGVCVAGLVGECVTVTAALCLVPAGVVAGLSRGKLARTALAGAVMALVASAGVPASEPLRAVLAVCAYVLSLHLTGGADLRQVVAFVRGGSHGAAPSPP